MNWEVDNVRAVVPAEVRRAMLDSAKLGAVLRKLAAPITSIKAYVEKVRPHHQHQRLR